MDPTRKIECAVITGVTRGLGRALAKWLIEAGLTVVGCGRSRGDLDALAAERPAPHRFDCVDVTDAAAVSAWSETVLESIGAPDLLINNAAIINRNAPLWQVPVTEFHDVTNVNINGVYHVIRAFVPAMIESRKGMIINLSSGWGRSVSADVAPYCTTKWAIEGLTRALAEELPSGLAAVALNPGVIDTEMLRSCFGSGASSAPKPANWAARAGPFILGLDLQDNGKSLSVP